jgi:ferrous iron transport protein A
MSGQVLARLGDSKSLDAIDAAPVALERSPGIPAAQDGRAVPLTQLPRHATGTVAGVRVQAGADGALAPDDERVALRLIEIGFVQGASLRVIAFGQPGDDPIGVRVGGRGGVSTFALRRLEAACVWVWPDVQS